MNLSLADAALLTLHEAALLPLQYSLPMIGDGIEVVPSYGRFHVHESPAGFVPRLALADVPSSVQSKVPLLIEVDVPTQVRTEIPQLLQSHVPRLARQREPDALSTDVPPPPLSVVTKTLRTASDF